MQEKLKAHRAALKALHNAAVSELAETSGLGELFKGCNFENWREVKGTEAALRECVDFIESGTYSNASREAGRGLILMGGAGSGKTHLAAAITNALLEKEVPCAFVSVPDWLAKIKRSFNGEAGQPSEAALVEPLLTADLLVLDDVGAEKASEWTQERLYEVIDGRYRNKKATVLTTNLDPAGLEKAIGSRSMDRLLQVNKIVKLNAPSFRRRAK